MRAYSERVGPVIWVTVEPGPGNFANDLAETVGRAPADLLLDLSRCRSLGSHETAALCRHLWAARARGSRIVLGGVQCLAVKRLVALAGFADYFPIEETVPAAWAHFRDGPRSLLGSMLLESGRINEDQLEEALRAQAAEAEPRRLGQILAERGHVDQSGLLRVLFKQKLNRIAA